MIRSLLGREQGGAVDLPERKLLANARLRVVGQSGRHRTRRNKCRRQVAELQRTDQQAGHDLVADSQAQRAIEHAVRQRYGGGQRNRVAREQRQLHAVVALGDAIAHRRHASGHLRRRAVRARRRADALGVVLVRPVRRQHVVVGGDDGEIGLSLLAHQDLVGLGHRRVGVGDVGAAQRAACRTGHGHRIEHRPVRGASDAAAGLDSPGHGMHDRMQRRNGVRWGGHVVGRSRGFSQRSRPAPVQRPDTGRVRPADLRQASCRRARRPPASLRPAATASTCRHESASTA